VNGTGSAGSWHNALDKLKLPVFVFLMLTGIFLESVVHYQFGISTVYTHFYYLIIVIAGLWYGRKAIGIALFFGVLQVVVSWVLEGTIPLDALIRALMLVIVAVIVGTVVERMKRYEKQMLVQNRELKEVNAQLDTSQQAFLVANKKLKLLSSITRHDIRNQLTALLAYIELSIITVQDPELKKTIGQEEIVAGNILRQIEFTQTYEDIGVRAPQWQNVAEQFSHVSPPAEQAGVQISVSTGGLQVYADPLLEKVFENLIDNSLRHGEHVRNIEVGCEKRGTGLVLLYRDNGIGVPDTEKEKIFEKGFGKNTGLGLFLIREILAITGLSIRECGQYGSGALFEIQVPEGSFRFG
jgi:signal transduction histidine kinase